MRALLCKTLGGGPADMVVEEVEEPEPQAGEIIIRVMAVGLNFFDTLIIVGKYQYRPAPPFSPGAEVSGIVASIGSGISGFAKGDRVMAFTGWGGARELVAVKAARVVAMPENAEFETAAAMQVTYGTSLHALKDRASLSAGETLAVLGAAGGTGQAAVELGKLMGARVIAVASSDEKLEFCKSVGADHGINITTEDVRERIKALTQGRGADVIYDPVGRKFERERISRHRLGRTIFDHRICLRRHCAAAAQSSAAERCRSGRCILGRASGARARATQIQYGEPGPPACR